MNKPCDHWAELLELYHDGELSRSKRQQVDEHLATCSGCRDQLQQLEQLNHLVARNTEQLLARMRPEQFDEMTSRVLGRLRQEQRPSWGERVGLWFEEFWHANRRAVLASAAAAGLALAIAWPMLRGTGDGGAESKESFAQTAASSANEVIIDSLQSGEHDMVLVNVHPEDMTTVIWLLQDDEGQVPAPSLAAPPTSGSGSPAGTSTMGTEPGSGEESGTGLGAAGLPTGDVKR